ncbi:MAG: sulfotransferase domain-containing protein [Acidimicrobiales bacterium]|nr:sulfotransferase domain-containing protein [Acidimicrobiales bacterium]
MVNPEAPALSAYEELPPDRPVPDFVLLGAMKAGSTTLFRRLEQHPAIAAGGTKEPNFFSRDENWSRGLDWYRTQLASGPAELLRGEASVEYADPRLAPTVMRRLVEVAPRAHILLVLRHPVERLRSHYRHEVQRSRERRPLAEAVLEPDNAYVRRSCYAPTIEAVLATVGAAQLLVLRSEQLDEEETWVKVLGHLGVSHIALPTTRYNVAAEKEGFTAAMLKLWERGWIDRMKRLPKPARKIGRRVLMRRGTGFDERMAASEAPVPESVVETLALDAKRTTELLGWGTCPWDF